MKTTKKSAPVAALIGDLVGSRRSEDRAALHTTLTHALEEVNDLLDPMRPLRVSVGDEHQAVFTSVGDALAATLLVRVRLAPEADVRHGVGWGQVAVLDEASHVEDGPGWWAARAAIEQVHAAQATSRSARLRTAYELAPDSSGPEPGPINAALLLRDEIVSGLSPRSLSVLRGLLGGRTQQEIAAALSISPSAVSQRVRADGLATVVSAHDLLTGTRGRTTMGGMTP